MPFVGFERKMKLFRSKILPLLGVGLTAGICSGLLGAGGGAVIVTGLTRVFPKEDRRAVFATALSVTAPLSFVSALRYGALAASGGALFPLSISALAGGVIGGFFLYRLPLFWLSRIFAGVLLLSGILMVVL